MSRERADKDASDTVKQDGSTQDSGKAPGTSRKASGSKARCGKACSQASSSFA
jgi:hypothetical protein